MSDRQKIYLFDVSGGEYVIASIEVERATAKLYYLDWNSKQTVESTGKTPWIKHRYQVYKSDADLHPSLESAREAVRRELIEMESSLVRRLARVRAALAGLNNEGGDQ